ncbi:hypothetical protein GVAV_002911 [Gurleya vavrai]
MRFFSKNINFTNFGYLFFSLCVIGLLIEKKSKSANVQRTMKTLINFFILLASCIIFYKSFHGVLHFIENSDSMIKNAKNLIFSGSSKFQQFFSLAKLLIIPLSTLCSVYYRFKQYQEAPDYRSKHGKINFFDGSFIKSDICDEKMKLPVLQLFSVFCNLLFAKNPVSVFISGVDILTMFNDFSGHKKSELYYPTILTSAMSIFMGFVHFSESLNHPWMTYQTEK